MKNALKIITHLDHMQKAEVTLAISWVAAMVIGYFTAQVNITVGSVFLVAAMAAALMGAVNEAMMSTLRQKFEKLSEDSQIFALWIRSS